MVAVLMLCAVSSTWAKSWQFAVMGDHRGDNKAPNVQIDPVTGKGIGYKDGGINKPVLQDLGIALKNEDVEFVLNVGDLVSKWRKEINGKTADVLLSEELADWANIWNTASGELPIYPVRGNQEVTASEDVWRNFTNGMPGIGQLRLNGPAGEEGLTFSFKHKNCLFVGIDQYVSPLADGDTHVITPEAQVWLDRLLSESDRPHTFVFGHTPAYQTWDSTKMPFTVVKDGLATPYAKFSYDFRGIDFVAMRDTFWSSLAGVGAEYFCGHEHIYGRGLAVDTEGRWIRQTIIGNGGAPVPPAFPSAYNLGPYIESYTGIALPTLPPHDPLVLVNPLIVSEAATRTNEFGYIIVEMHGAKVVATYKAEPAAGAGFQVIETWTIAEGEEE
jgi:hypothetical protein